MAPIRRHARGAEPAVRREHDLRMRQRAPCEHAGESKAMAGTNQKTRCLCTGSITSVLANSLG